ncbi:MAG: heme exporter protein CcmB [Actinomycetota bacterium]|nr:heme exporter protein CcmB [Actinomycetota bacterium]
MRELLTDLRLVAAKDLRIELRSRVVANQVAPFAVLVLVLFGVALDADQRTLRSFAPGLFWMAVLFCALLAVQRSAAIEQADEAAVGLSLSGISPAGLFLGKATAVFVQLLALEVLLTGGIVVLYRSSIEDVMLLVLTGLMAGVAVAAAGTLYGAMAAGLGVRETLLPILLLPVLAPVLIGATRAFDDALGAPAVDGWTWLALLAGLAATMTIFGALAHRLLVDD